MARNKKGSRTDGPKGAGLNRSWRPGAWKRSSCHIDITGLPISTADESKNDEVFRKCILSGKHFADRRQRMYDGAGPSPRLQIPENDARPSAGPKKRHTSLRATGHRIEKNRLPVKTNITIFRIFFSPCWTSRSDRRRRFPSRHRVFTRRERSIRSTPLRMFLLRRKFPAAIPLSFVLSGRFSFCSLLPDPYSGCGHAAAGL